ncbi:hypothetical protein CEP51_012338 [Fusarium floridanum]|uniref:P-type ATPase A domain-containing protein n=1 Tax=Fusarium floridanum TaxID=1325733 RepID=A0A428QVI3_9HYPO|nr:hypothetical protein CEP51_012338 [Fusarium floridanum]
MGRWGLENGQAHGLFLLRYSSRRQGFSDSIPNYTNYTKSDRTTSLLPAYYSTTYDFARTVAMEGSTRHEAQPLDPNPDDLFEDENIPFASSFGGYFRFRESLTSNSLAALLAFGGVEDLKRSLRVDQENGPYVRAIAETVTPGCFTDGPLRTKRSFLDGAYWHSIFDTNKPSASPEPSFFSIPRLKPPNNPPKLFEVRRLDKTCVVSVNDILVGDLLLLKAGDVVPTDGILIDGPGIACDESALTGESDLIRKVPSNDVGKELRELPEDEGLKRTSSKGHFIPAGSRVVDGTGTYLVTAVGQDTTYRRGQASHPKPTPLEGSAVHWLKVFGSGLFLGCLALLCGLFSIAPSLWHLLHVPAKSARGAKNALETISNIDFETYCIHFIPLVLLVPSLNSMISSTDSLQSSSLVLAILILQHRRQLKPVLDQILSSYQSVMSSVKTPPSINTGNRGQSHWKSTLTLLALLHGTPVIAIAWAPTRALRIASGVTASGTAAAVIPLRTLDDVPSWAWISDYTVWIICFAAYLTLQIHHIPCRGDHRRQLYLFLVILLAIHFAIALAQSSPTLIDGFTIFGPMVLTVTTFLVALLFGAIPAMEARGDGGGTEEITTGTSPHPIGISMTALSICG